MTKVKPEKVTETATTDLAEEVKAAEEKVIAAREKVFKTIKTVEERISKIENETGTFCGVVLSQEDLIEALKLSLKTNEPVKIPYRIYLK